MSKWSRILSLWSGYGFFIFGIIISQKTSTRRISFEHKLADANQYLRGDECMSVVIVGGNECMTRQYKDLCGKYKCKAKVYPKMTNGLKDIGTPDLLILFTNTVSHKMIRLVLSDMDERTRIARSHSSSMAALKGILDEHIG